MKKLRQTLALVLAVLLLVSVIPFTAVAEGEYSAAFILAKVNGEAYDASKPILSGDQIEVDIVADPGSDTLRGYMFGFTFDSDALSFGTDSVSFAEGSKYHSCVVPEGESYYRIGAMYTSAAAAATVATLTFTASETFSGETTITVNQGASNKLSIMRQGQTKTESFDLVLEDLTFHVYALVDKTELEQTITAAEALDADDYTPNSWTLLSPALEAARTVFNDAFALQEDIDDAKDALADVISNQLVLRADKGDLIDLCFDAQDYLDMTEVYKAEALAALQAAINAANVVLDDDNATQEAVNEQYALVQAAIAALANNKNEIAVTFKDATGGVFATVYVPYGENVVLPETTPVKASDNEYNYTFKNWDGQTTNITEEVTLTPVYTSSRRTYTITFLDEDNTLIEEQTYYYGDTITPPADPTKEQDNENTYAFDAWAPAIDTVTSDATYTATYTSTQRLYEIKFVSEGVEIASYNLPWGAQVTVPADPTKAQDDVNTYTFTGWNPQVVNVAGDATYVAGFEATAREYEVVFLNEDGQPILSKTYHWGDEVEIPADPTKDADDTYTHAFTGWSPAVSAVCQGDAVYAPTFSDDYKDYTVKFVDEDGTQIGDTQTIHFGGEVVMPADPTKAQDNENTYAFDKWVITADMEKCEITYTATYTATARVYEIKFLNEGEELASYSLNWGAEVVLPENPTKAADAQYIYTFAGWDPQVVNVAGDATYTAVYSSDLQTYTVYFLNDDNSIFAQADYKYGETPVAPEGTPVKADDDLYFYTFAGWDAEFTAVTGDVNYKAQFTAAYLDANYSAVTAAVEEAEKYNNEENYTSTSYTRLVLALQAIEPDLKINEQEKVNGFATAINDAIAALVSTTAYDAVYAKCAAVNNNGGLYTSESYSAFETAFAAIGAKIDFDTPDATQADVDAATADLEAAYALLEAETLNISGPKALIGERGILTASNTTILNTELVANDGGAGTAELKFYDANGDVFTNTNKRIGTGFVIELLQFGSVIKTVDVIIFGDINGDGMVSLADIRLAKKMLVSTDGFSEAQILAAKCGGADIDVEEVINIAKAI